MEELFRFIQQATVVPADGSDIDLIADTRFQRELRVLSAQQPYSAVRARAEAFLNHVTGSPPIEPVDPAEEYTPSRFQRVAKHVVFRDRLLMLLVAGDIVDDRVNQAAKDVYGAYPSQLVGDPEFKTDKNFASDLLIAIKLITRFDKVDVNAVSTMRRTIALIDDMVAGTATAGWHPIQLAPPSTAADGSDVASVSRDPDHMNLWWLQQDGSLHGAEWAASTGWGAPAAVPGVDSAAISAGIAAISRDGTTLSVWWIGKDGSVNVVERAAEGWKPQHQIAGPNSASTSSGLAALSRNPGHQEVWWIAKDGSVHNAWWTDTNGWQVNSNLLAGPNSASTSSSVTVLSRSSTHMEVWWVGKNRSVQGAWWIEGAGWNGPYPVADPESAADASGLAAVSRTPTHMAVWWVGKDGSVQEARWSKAQGWQRPDPVAGRNSASTTSGVTALARSSISMRVWWIGQDRSVQEARWSPDGWQQARPVAEANSASSSSGIAALSRIPTHMELNWVGKDRAVQDAWWLDTVPEDAAAEHMRALLERPLQVPEEFLPPPRVAITPEDGNPPEDPHADLIKEHDAFQRAYDTLMSVPAAQLEIKTLGGSGPPHLAAAAQATRAGEQQLAGSGDEGDAVPTVLGVSSATLELMESVVKNHLQTKLGTPQKTSLEDLLDVVKRRWLDLSKQVEPLRAPMPARIFRLGMNLFAVQEPTALRVAARDASPAPDFSHAVTRPVGIGDLQVVRQRLIGYEAADISHIENVLPGELMRRTTLREETSELVITDDIETTQSEERDTQSTQRNELVVEAQKEATQQSATTAEQTSTSNYGRLVENSKSNYARSVTDRAVNKLTQTVRQQRIQRERKVFSDKAEHQMDNSTGNNAICGIYQWVDKKYQVQVLNYGKRLLYDVVVPEPAAFLINTLKTAAQPENFQLSRPTKPTLQPGDLNAANYVAYATLYGVTGAVTPPPAELTTVFANTNAEVAGTTMDAYGNNYKDKQFYGHFKITVPPEYTAIGGYVTRTSARFDKDVAADFADNRRLEFYIGENTFIQFTPTVIKHTFTLPAGETGDIPVTVNSFKPVLQFNYSVAIKCRRTDSALEQWKLKTHAAIMAGYERQRTNFLDELSRYQAAVRAQLALASAFSRDVAVERQELKKAFIHLLTAEHITDVYIPAPADPTKFPPDPSYPNYVKKWGAVAAFFERAFEWEHLMYVYYPYFWGRREKWGELILIQDLDPQFEAFLKAGAARVVIPVRPGFEAALAHYHETGDVWMGEEIPDMFSKQYVSIIAEIKARNAETGSEVRIEQWETRLPTTLVIARTDANLPAWAPDPDSDAGN